MELSVVDLNGRSNFDSSPENYFGDQPFTQARSFSFAARPLCHSIFDTDLQYSVAQGKIRIARG